MQIWKRLYQNSVGNFMTALGRGDELTDQDLEELQEFLDRAVGDNQGIAFCRLGCDQIRSRHGHKCDTNRMAGVHNVLF